MKLEKYFDKSWIEVMGYLHTPHFLKVAKWIAERRKLGFEIIPEKGSNLLFNIFKIVPYNKVKVVILGQDPYTAENAYDGIAFSNSFLLQPQPSLTNILKEVESDIYNGFNLERIANISLYDWAEQGVFLVNTAHTVENDVPGSHLKVWKKFTISMINAINKKNDVVWMLWGRKAQAYEEFNTNPSHAIIKTAHPSPLGCKYKAPIPFVGSKCFSKANYELEIRNKKEIRW